MKHIFLDLPSSQRKNISKLKLPVSKTGNEEYLYDIGETVTASNLAPYRGQFKITDRYKQNGFCYYVCDKVTLREKDIEDIDGRAANRIEMARQRKELFLEFCCK